MLSSPAVLPLRVAALNASPQVGDVGANVRAAAEWAERAAAEGAHLLLFPEAWTTGYDADVFAGSLPSRDDVSWLDPLQDVVDRTGITVLLNSPLQSGAHKTLSTVVLSAGAAARPIYDKQHLFEPERGVFTPGTGGTIVSVRGHDIGVSVCYDVDFAEHAAAAAADGATVYVNSGAYFSGSERRRDLRYAARALDNGIHVVFSGLVGRFVGGSAIYDPEGRALAKRETDEGLVVADIDTASAERTREQQRAWADRLPTLGSRRHVVID